MKYILGQKKQMTQIFQADGTATPITVVRATPNTVTALRTKGKNGYDAVQLGYGHRSPKRVAKAQRQQWGQAGPFRFVREIRGASPAERQLGQTVDVGVFQPGDVVQVSGVSKGRGFAGVVKRHHFKGGPASHGHKDNLRAPGSIGATFPQHVTKGTRMAGHLGHARVTVKNLTVAAVKPEAQELWLSGAIPGPINGFLIIRSRA